MPILLAQVKTPSELLPPRGSNVYPGGYQSSDKGEIRYSHPSSTNPNLMIINPISDNDRNIIMPGYYELALSDDKQMLMLVQAGKIIATFPVFKLEEDKNQEPIQQPNSWISQKKYDREQKKKEKEKKKLLKEGKMLEEPEIYNKASIEFEPDGNYYLIKYERGKIRAWGAIK